MLSRVLWTHLQNLKKTYFIDNALIRRLGFMFSEENEWLPEEETTASLTSHKTLSQPDNCRGSLIMILKDPGCNLYFPDEFHGTRNQS